MRGFIAFALPSLVIIANVQCVKLWVVGVEFEACQV